jgi:hypothetical protein
VSGRQVSLRQLEEEVIRPFGDARAWFAVRCLSTAGPRMPRKPFAAAHLDEQLDQLMREFMDDRRNVEVHASGRRVWLSPLIQAYAAEPHQAGLAEVEFCNRWRTRPIPAHCAVEYPSHQMSGLRH